MWRALGRFIRHPLGRSVVGAVLGAGALLLFGVVAQALGFG